jgi:hypothetical protein
MIPIVASGKESAIEMTYERSAMEACLAELERHDYLIPDFHGSKSERLNRMILLVFVRDLHKETKMTLYVSFCQFNNIMVLSSIV